MKTCSNCRGEGLVGVGDEPWLRNGPTSTCKVCDGKGEVVDETAEPVAPAPVQEATAPVDNAEAKTDATTASEDTTTDATTDQPADSAQEAQADKEVLG